MKKWIRHEEPKENSGLYIVWYDFGDGKEIKAYMNEYDFKVAKIEKELLDKGYDEKDLERYKEAVYDQTYDSAMEGFAEESL